MSNIPRKELIALMALLMSLTALSIDGILPAFSFIKNDLSIVSDNHTQFIISSLFVGLIFGQIVFGPLSDSYGRRTGVIIGIIFYIIGSLISLFSSSFLIMLVGRALQGFGAAATRVISVAIIRDLYSGREMAQIMSFIMTVFILVPMFAPIIGEGIIIVSGWRMIFVFYLMFAIVSLAWIFQRLTETLPIDKREKLSADGIIKGFSCVFKNKITMGYTLIAGSIFGGFIGYLSSAQQIFQDFFNTGQLFSIYFGMTALAIGIASLVNGLLVKRFGMRRICSVAFIILMVASALFMVIFDLSDSDGLFIPYMTTAFIIFCCFGLLFGNINSLAMEPMADQAGTAAAVIGSLSTAISLLIGSIIGQCFNMTLYPLIIGFFSLSSSSLMLHLILQKKP